MFNPFKHKKKRRGTFGFIFGRLSLKTKIIIGLISLFVLSLLSLIFFTVSMDELEEIDKKVPDITENTSRPIYSGNQAKVTVTDTTTQQMQFEEVMNQGNFNANEAQVLAALQKLNIELNEEYVKGGKKMPGNITKFIKENLPSFIAIYVKRGLLPGTGILQGGLESGWGGHIIPGSNNYFGIKAAGPHTDYWKGAYVSAASGEGEGSSRRVEVSKFRKYNNMFESKMDWGEFLYTNKRYKPAFSKQTSLDQIKAIQYAGYSNSPNTYIGFATSMYSKYNMKRFDDLARQVKQIIAKEGGTYSTPSGTTIPNGEWKPQPVIQTDTKWGYFVDPAKGRISSCFAKRVNPVTHKTEIHRGLDFAVPTGTTVYAARSGVVYESRRSSSYGNVVTIDHGDGFYTRYAHNSKLLVNKGDKIVKGQEIAKSGSTGQSSGPHIHFEVIKGDPTVRENRTNPLSNFYEQFNLNGKNTVRPRGAKAFNAQKITADPGTVAGENASASAGYNKTTPTSAPKSLVEACSFLKEQGIDPSTLSKERLAVFYEGHKWFGSWYAWGGKTPPKKNPDGSWQKPHRTGGWVGGYALSGPGFDCSGYVGWIFKQVFNVNMGSGSYEQGHSKYAKLIDTNATKPGDLYWHSGHIAIAVKVDSKYVYVMQSPQTGEQIGWGRFKRSQPHRIVRPTFYKD